MSFELYKQKIHKSNWTFPKMPLNPSYGATTTTEETQPCFYEPYDHRDDEISKETNAQAFENLVKGILGTGILALPYVYKHSGYVLGPILLTFVAVLTTYAFFTMFKTNHSICIRKQVPYLTYPEAFAAAFETGPPCARNLGTHMKIVIEAFLVIYQLGVLVIYYLFCTQVFQHLTETWVDVNCGVFWYGTILLIPFLLIMCVKDLTHFAKYSLLGNVFMFISIFTIVAYVIKDGLPPLSDRTAIGSIKALPMLIGTVSFSYAAIGVIIAVESTMKNPGNITKTHGVLSQAIALTVVLYCVFSHFAYVRYGDEVKGMVILNLPEDNIAAIASVCIFIAIYMSFPLNAFYPLDVLFNRLWLPRLQENKSRNIPEFTVRFGMVFFAWIIAVLVPHTELLISLLGSICLPPLLFMFPPIMDILVHWPCELRVYKYRLCANLLIILYSIFVLAVGTYQSLRSIADTFSA